jgi:hypothetical protein
LRLPTFLPAALNNPAEDPAAQAPIGLAMDALVTGARPRALAASGLSAR